MEHKEARERLLDFQRGRLSEAARAEVAAHLESCADCRHAADAEAALSDALANRLPRHAASPALREKLAARLAAQQPVPSPRPRAERIAARRWSRLVAPVASALAAAALVLVGVRVTQPSFLLRPAATASDLVDEGVNDHLRVVTSAHPIEIESGGIHQVKPWFTGRLDFAPRVSFIGDDQYQLLGGNIGYFRDRKAAVFVFKLRLHTITLFVFRADELPWPTRNLTRVGPLDVAEQVSRGFSVLMWRAGELGYCLVSDVNRADLETLAIRVAQGS